jgi:hypothetical protein
MTWIILGVIVIALAGFVGWGLWKFKKVFDQESHFDD